MNGKRRTTDTALARAGIRAKPFGRESFDRLGPSALRLRLEEAVSGVERLGAERPDPLSVLHSTFCVLHSEFGPQHWWPGDTAFEMMVGAILTQNTNWGNVERAIANLKAAGALDPRRLAELPPPRLAELIRPSGCFRVKAKRLREFVLWLRRKQQRAGNDGMAANRRKGAAEMPPVLSSVSCASARQNNRLFRRTRTERLRRELLGIHGIGPETADSILLYALRRRKFVVDAYTRRFLARHGLIAPGATYAEIQSLFERNLPPSQRLYNEYHALIVRLGKEFCRTKPRCDRCPLEPLLGAAPHLLPPGHEDTQTKRTAATH